MKYLMLLVCSFCVAQSKPIIETSFQDKTSIDEKGLIFIDDFGTTYSLDGNSLVKTTTDNIYRYSNVQLGEVSSVDVFNPLKINIFYEDFNTVVILDNRLADIYISDFNANKSYKNVSHISTGYDNTIWLFNQDNLQLELFDYKANTTKVRTLPLDGEVLDITSNYNYCWLLTKDFLYKFNYFGINILKYNNDGYTSIKNIEEDLILQKDKKLYFLKNNLNDPIEIQLPKLLINDFFVNNETLYIYDNEFLYKYLLKIN